jgi:hypothetical protein
MRRTLILTLNPTPLLFILLTFALLGFITLFFLHAFWELKKPKDAGPRRIAETTIEGIIRNRHVATSQYKQLPLEALWGNLIDIEGGEPAKLSISAIGLPDYETLLPNIEV